jgi:hypothetical protein
LILAEEKLFMAASFGLGELGAITVIVQDHVTGVIANDGIRMRCCIFEEVNNGIKSGLSALALCGNNRANGRCMYL